MDSELTVEEAAQRLHLSPKTIRIYAAEGRIPGAYQKEVTRLEWRFPERDLQDYKPRVKTGRPKKAKS